MRIIVQKFGGTSVATAETRQLVQEKIEYAIAQGGAHPVVVVSAIVRQGDSYATDTLLELARSTYANVSFRELDQIASYGEIISAMIMTAKLQAAGRDAVMLTGGQAGILTDINFTNGRIQKVDPSRIMELLRSERIPVVCGFQGITTEGDFTTLGRGESDTIATALGAALDAELVEIYTDVDGVMTADPRIVKSAQVWGHLSYDNAYRLVNQGAKVINPRAVEIAMQNNIPIVIKSTFSHAPGTLISHAMQREESGVSELVNWSAIGVTYLNNLAQIRLYAKETGRHNIYPHAFRILADQGINANCININPGNIIFTIPTRLLEQAVAILNDLDYELQIVTDCAMVSIVGGGTREASRVMVNFMEALSKNKINILQIADSHTSISALVAKEDVVTAVNLLHETFGLCEKKSS